MSGGIEAKGIDPQQQFNNAAMNAPKPASAYITLPIKPEGVQKIVENLNTLQGRTDDSRIDREIGSGTVKYSLIDTRNNQPLAEMTRQGGQGWLTLYQSPENLAKRIDSNFVSARSIRDFLDENRMDAPSAQMASHMKQ